MKIPWKTFGLLEEIMGFKLQLCGSGKWELILNGEPDYIQALEMAPRLRETILDSGIWLVVVFSIASGPDRHSVMAAIDCAKKFQGEFLLGIRPYEFYEENNSWWPVAKIPQGGGTNLVVRDGPTGREIHISADPAGSPTWLVLRNGQCIYQGVGPRSEEQLREIMQKAIC